MAAGRSAAAKIDWSKIGSSLGLRGNTASQLQAFKARNDAARRRVAQLSEQPQTVDFAHYRSILGNQAVVDQIEGEMKNYKVKSIDVNKQLKAIETFEAQAVKQAEETSKIVENELKDLKVTLKNIDEARPFDQCTVDDVKSAAPEIDRKVEHMVKNHRWMPPGYQEKYGNLSVL